MEGERLALGDTKGERLLFPAPVEQPLKIAGLAVGQRGDQIAASFGYEARSTLEFYAPSTLAHLGSISSGVLPGPVSFDQARNSFQLPIKDALGNGWGEARLGEPAARLGAMSEGSIWEAVRSSAGIVFATTTYRNPSVYLTAPDNTERLILEKVATATVNRAGDVVFTIEPRAMSTRSASCASGARATWS